MNPLETEAAVRAELEAARTLHACQGALARAMAEGRLADVLLPLVREQAEAVEAASRAARQRAALLPDRGAVERWITAEPARLAERRALVEAGQDLRRRIDVEARRSAYLARRVALWNETQRAWIAEALLRETRAEGYGPSSRGGLSASLDRTV